MVYCGDPDWLYRQPRDVQARVLAWHRVKTEKPRRGRSPGAMRGTDAAIDFFFGGGANE
jgi:hypothetical protein